MSDKNPNGGISKTVVFVCVAGIAGIGAIGLILLTVHRPDATATFIQQFAQIFGSLVGFVTVLYALNEVKKSTDTIKDNTNGKLDRLMRERDEARQESEYYRRKYEAPNGKHVGTNTD